MFHGVDDHDHDHEDGAHSFEHIRDEALQQTTRAELDALLSEHKDDLTPEQKREIERAFAAKQKENEPGSKKSSSEIEKKQKEIKTSIERDGSTELPIARMQSQIESGYLANIQDVRKQVRQQVLVALGISKEEELKSIVGNNRELIRLVAGFQYKIQKAVDDYLVDRKHKLAGEAIAHRKRIDHCFAKSKELFDANEAFEDFVFVLGKYSIPHKVKDAIGGGITHTEIKKYIADMRDFWDDPAVFEERASYWDVVQLDEQVTTMSELFHAWQQTEAKTFEELHVDMRTYSSTIYRLDNALKNNPEIAEEMGIGTDSRDTWLQQIATDFDQIQTEVKPAMSSEDRKFVSTYLATHQPRLDAVIREVREKAAAKQMETQRSANDNKTTGKSGKKDEIEPPTFEREKEKRPEKNVLGKIGGAVENMLTVGGAIKYWTLAEFWGDVEGAFKLWHEIRERERGDATGGIKGGILKRIDQAKYYEENRTNVMDYYRGESEKRAKPMLGYPLERIMYVLEGKPDNIGTRAALITLANRGYLHLGDRKLMRVVMRALRADPIPDADWDEYKRTLDLTRIRAKFIKAADGFLWEPGIGEEYLEKQRHGYEKAQKEGESTGSNAETQSVAEQVYNLSKALETIDITGDGRVIGIMKSLAGRGDINAKNGSKIALQIETDVGSKKIENDADSGFVILKLIDLYLQGKVAGESIGSLARANDSGYFPYSTLDELCVKIDVAKDKNTGESKYPGQTIFEGWGWVRNGKIVEKHIGDIINFFNTRVARTAKGEAVHIATDSRAYKNNSSKFQTFRSAKSSGVGEKMGYALVKAATTEYFATAVRKEHGHSFHSEPRDLMCLIRGAVENIQDGANLAAENKLDENGKNVGKEMLKKYSGILGMMFSELQKQGFEIDAIEESDHGIYTDNNGKKHTKLQEYLRATIGALREHIEVDDALRAYELMQQRARFTKKKGKKGGDASVAADLKEAA